MDRGLEPDRVAIKVHSHGNDPLLSPIHSSLTKGIQCTGDVASDLLNKTKLEQDRKIAQYETKIQHRSLLLHPTTSSDDSRVRKAELKRKQLESKRKPRPLSAKEKRHKGFNSMRDSVQKYSIYLSLHELWTGYMQEIIKGGGCEAKFLKADYHGARVRITKSSCPSILFISGIVVRETRHTFVVCTMTDALKIIPKKCTVFEFELSLAVSSSVDALSPPELIRWEIYGEHFGFRAADRVGKKFKGKHTIDF